MSQISTRRKDYSWKPLIRLLKRSNLPWWLYILQIIVMFVITQVAVLVTNLTGDIIGGNILDDGVLWQFSLLSFLEISLGLFGIFAIWVAIRFDKKIQMTTWKRFIRLPIRVYEKLVPSTLISRVTTDSIRVGGIVAQVVELLAPIMMLIAFVFSMTMHSADLTLTVVPIIVLYSLILFFGQDIIFSITFQLQENMALMTSFLAEKLGSIRIIKANATEKEEMQKGRVINEDRFRISMMEAKFSVVLESLQSVMELIITALVIILGSMRVAAGTMEMASLISFYLFALSIPMQMEALLLGLIELQATKGMTARVSEITDLPQEEISSSRDLPEELQDIALEDVHFSYDGETDVLSGVSFTIPAGKTTAIIGPSGSGKTTILKLLERFYVPHEGKITYGGINAEEIHMNAWRENFGYVIQNSPLLSGTVRENILYGAAKEISEKSLQEVLEMSNATEFIDELDDGLDTDIGELGMKLSGGQRQRIAVARSLINRPNILLLDEATANMDALNEAEITSSILELMQGKTSVVVAHNLRTIRDADQIVVLEGGRVVGAGTHEELYSRNPLYTRLIDLQHQLNRSRRKGEPDDSGNHSERI